MVLEPPSLQNHGLAAFSTLKMQPNRSFSRVRATKARKLHGFVAVNLPKPRKTRAKKHKMRVCTASWLQSKPWFRSLQTLVKYVVFEPPSLQNHGLAAFSALKMQPNRCFSRSRASKARKLRGFVAPNLKKHVIYVLSGLCLHDCEDSCPLAK